MVHAPDANVHDGHAVTRMRQETIREAGVFGLNTEDAFAVQDPRWLTEALNLVFDDSGRLTSRKGLEALTTTGDHSDATDAIHEYIQSSTVSQIISAGGSKIYRGTTALTDITGTTTATTADWEFVNFNGKCIAVQQGETMAVYSGTSFAPIVASSGTVPSGNSVLSSWGRLWAADSTKRYVNYCATLDETDWGGAGAGVIDTWAVWPDGPDEVIAIEEWQDNILIFGTRSILLYRWDRTTSGSFFFLEDIIHKGTRWRDSVVPVGRDLIFLSDDGLRSVSRGLVSQTIPLSELSTQVSTKLIAQERDATKVQAGYSPADKAYLLRIVQVDTEFFWYFDLGRRLETGDLRAIEWSGINWQSIALASDLTVYLGTTGKVARHSGYQDNGSSYTAEWMTSGSEVGESGEKIMKHGRMQFRCSGSTPVRFRWALDLDGTIYSESGVAECPSTASEWNVSEWGEDEWTGLAGSVETVGFDLSESGYIVQIGGSVTVNGSAIAFSNPQLLFKTGRLAA